MYSLQILILPVHLATHFPWIIDVPLCLDSIFSSFSYSQLSVHLLVRVSVPFSPHSSVQLDHCSQAPQEAGSRKKSFLRSIFLQALAIFWVQISYFLFHLFVRLRSLLAAVVTLALPVRSSDFGVKDTGTPIPIIKHKTTIPIIRAFLRFISLPQKFDAR